MRAGRNGLVCLLVAVSALAGCTADDPEPRSPTDDAPTDSSEARAELAAEVDLLAPLSLAPLPAMRLADGLTPPTNRWFSGLVFGEQANPVFPLPLVLTSDATSFGFGLPQIDTSADHVIGSNVADVTVSVQGVESQQVGAYDVASVSRDGLDESGRPLGRTVVAQGSPFVSHVAQEEETLTTSVPFSGSGDVLTTETPTGTWAVRLVDGEADGDTLVLDRGGSAVFFPVPADGDLATLAELAVPLTGTTSSFDVGDDEVTTEVTYVTEGDAETATGRLPHQSADSDAAGCDLGTFPTVYGELVLCRGTSLSWAVPRVTATAELDLSALDDSARDELRSAVTDDVAALPDPPADTYFGGKWAYRTAQLLSIADQVGAEQAADEARTQLTEVLTRWSEPDGCATRDEFCFGYDADWKGVTGQVPSFGSELFNDHHFHYGYFLYASAVLAAHDPGVVDDLAPMMRLLTADIAAATDTGVTPQWRAFDVYAGHSWAAGTGEFADGNNQESSSEAVTAWAGLGLWAEAVGDDELARQAEWMLASEASTATAYWTGFDLDDPVYDGFSHGVMGINWGAKRDYATWFSAEPSAILGIQLIPMSPSSDYLAGDPDRIASNAGEVEGGPLADYVLMYSALAGGDAAEAAIESARELPDADIDQGNSRSYVLAYLLRLGAAGD